MDKGWPKSVHNTQGIREHPLFCALFTIRPTFGFDDLELRCNFFGNDPFKLGAHTLIIIVVTPTSNNKKVVYKNLPPRKENYFQKIA